VRESVDNSLRLLHYTVERRKFTPLALHLALTSSRFNSTQPDLTKHWNLYD